MTTLEFDEKMARQLEVMYQTRDLVRRRGLVRDALAAAPGERILDVGCGSGFYAAELVDVVGPDGSVVGIDNSPAMLSAAAARVEGHDNIAFHVGDAASLPVEDSGFDAALSVQVFEYVPDVPAALAEMHRVLREGGRLVLWDVDWATVSMYTTDRAQTQRFLRAWDEHLVHPSLPQMLSAHLRSAGFDDVRLEGHTFATNELVPDSYGGSLVPTLARFAVGRGGITKDEAIAWEAGHRRLAASGEFFFSVTQFCFQATRVSKKP
jgi:ubiquinone/menaquinone biosynthesis C-methylase UbiE